MIKGLDQICYAIQRSTYAMHDFFISHVSSEKDTSSGDLIFRFNSDFSDITSC